MLNSNRISESQFVSKQYFMDELKNREQGMKTIKIGVIVDSRDELKGYQGLFRRIEKEIIRFAEVHADIEINSSKIEFIEDKIDGAMEFMHENLMTFCFRAENSRQYLKNEILPVMVIISGLPKKERKNTYAVLKYQVEHIKQNNGLIMFIALNDQAIEIAKELKIDEIILLKDWNVYS